MIFMGSGVRTSKSPGSLAPTTRARQDRNGASPNPDTVTRTKAKLPYKNRISRDASREDEDQRRKLHCLKLFKNRHERRGAICDTGGEKAVKRVKKPGPEPKNTSTQAHEQAPRENKGQDPVIGSTFGFDTGNYGLQVGANYGSIHLMAGPENKKALHPPQAPSKNSTKTASRPTR